MGKRTGGGGEGSKSEERVTKKVEREGGGRKRE